MGDFIEVYDNALPPEVCAQLVRAFEASGAAVPGQVGGGVLPELKDSRDIQITGKPEWREANNALNHAVFAGLLSYLRKYRYALISPLMLQVAGADGKLRRIAADDFDTMDDEALASLVRAVMRPGAINLQRYTAGQGVIPTGIANCIRATRAARRCTGTCCGRSTSTTASMPAKPSSCTRTARSCRRRAAC